MFDVVELYCDENQKRNFPFSQRIHTSGWHWKHYYADVLNALAQNIIKPLTSLMWVIPPNQEVIDVTGFVRESGTSGEWREIEDFSTDCFDRHNRRIENGGPFRFNPTVKYSTNSFAKRDYILTRHLGYSPEDGKTEFRWDIPSDLVFEPGELDYMVRPNEIDPSKDYGFQMTARTKFGLLPVGPKLLPRKWWELVDEINYQKVIIGRVPSPPEPVYDGVMLVYHEPNWEQSYDRVKNKLSMRVINGVKGIDNAHYAAAEACTTEYIWVIDADCEVDEDFDFRYKVPVACEPSLFVWKSRNIVNGLHYGNGGIKLIHRESLLARRRTGLDFTDFTKSMERHCDIHYVDQVVSTTMIDRDPFMAWRAGFREGYKLWGLSMDGDREAGSRLLQWTCDKNESPNRTWASIGAKQAQERFDELTPELINDFDWLREEWQKLQ